ncbi:MAG: thiamine phosphate synthase [Chloroflexota bacterium]
MTLLDLPAFYAILDPEQTAGRPVEAVLDELLKGGTRWLQLRVKLLAPTDFFELAQRVRAHTWTRHCTLIINDRVDIALACNADGVHLGQEDLPLAAARKLLANKIIGISTHNLAQARKAENGGADYIGFGPLFGTSTKETGYAARGVEMLRQIRSAIKIPIVAIGGITEQNVQQVWRAGADSAAIISDLLRADDIAGKVARIMRQQQNGKHL